MPWTVQNGWVVNLAPIFSPIGPQEVVEYDTLTFTVEATDPDGDNIVSLYAEALPAGASFDPATGHFSWRPDGTQAGVSIVSFFAVDDGDPAETGRIDVVITVGAVQSPTDLTDMGGGIWSVVLDVEENSTVIFKFITDGSLYEDVPPACGADDGYGGYNRAVEIGTSPVVYTSPYAGCPSGR